MYNCNIMADNSNLLFIGGGVLVLGIVAYMFLKKSSPVTKAAPGQTTAGTGTQACTLPGGGAGVMTATGCLPSGVAAVASGAGTVVNALAPLAALVK